MSIDSVSDSESISIDSVSISVDSVSDTIPPTIPKEIHLSGTY